MPSHRYFSHILCVFMIFILAQGCTDDSPEPAGTAPKTGHGEAGLPCNVAARHDCGNGAWLGDWFFGMRPQYVIPAHAGIQGVQRTSVLDSRFRGSDGIV